MLLSPFTLLVVANTALILGLILEVALSHQPLPAFVGGLLIGLSIVLNGLGVFHAVRGKRE